MEMCAYEASAVIAEPFTRNTLILASTIVLELKWMRFQSLPYPPRILSRAFATVSIILAAIINVKMVL
jgi:hypothetical protein